MLEGPQLVHYWCDNSQEPPLWNRGQVITNAATGAGCLIQSHFGAIGNFEAIVPEGQRLQHYWHVNEGPAGSLGERFYFLHQHDPTGRVSGPLPRHDVDFSFGSPYGQYNWELFVYIPLLMMTGSLTLQNDFRTARVQFLAKPFRMEELKRQIEAVIGASASV